MVRARSRAHLVALKNRFPDLLGITDIQVSPDADYAFRIFIGKAAWVVVLAALGEDVSYDNFKDAAERVAGKDGGEYLSALHKVWSVMHGFQEKVADIADHEDVSPVAVRVACKADWKTRPMPKKHVVVPFIKHLNSREAELVRRGLIPEEMEQKWFIYWEGDTLHFHRSWTGYCIYKVTFEPEGNGLAATQLRINHSPTQHKGASDDHDRQMAAWLIDALLLGKQAEWPGMPDDS
jgi:hypothetical protein